MSSQSILTDLQTRIGSNTLTSLQQELLTQALSVVIPEFPSTDDSGASAPTGNDYPASRAWMNPLYALIAQASGGTNVNPTTVTQWWIDPVAGSDTNSGTSSSSPLATAAALATLWKGSVGGGRPILRPATGTTITINIVNSLHPSDPIAPLLDVDLAEGTFLQFFGGAQAANLTGQIATANAWARTAANGQVKLTSAGVDWSTHIGAARLIQATGVSPAAVAWLYGGTATGLFTPGYSQQTAGVFSPAPTQTAFAAPQNFALVPLVTASIGDGFTTRTFPDPQQSDPATGGAVIFYRMSLTNTDKNATVVFNCPGVEYILQEAEIDVVAVQVIAGLVTTSNGFFHNCAVSVLGSGEVIGLDGGGVGGGTLASLTASQGGKVIVDLDFAVSSATAVTASEAAQITVGNAGFWVGAGGNAAYNAQTGGVVGVGKDITNANAVAYGSDGGQVVDCQGGGTLYYGQATSVACFAFTDAAFKMGGSTTAGFGFNAGTGALTGPTTFTFAHVDAALAAGTGFGGTALNVATGDRFLAAVSP
jgi:hypothetical protein